MSDLINDTNMWEASALKRVEAFQMKETFEKNISELEEMIITLKESSGAIDSKVMRETCESYVRCINSMLTQYKDLLSYYTRPILFADISHKETEDRLKMK